MEITRFVHLERNLRMGVKTIKLTNEIREQGQKVFSKAFQEALDQGMPLQIETERLLESRGLLNFEEQDRKINELRSAIRRLENCLRNGKDPETGRSLSKEEAKEIAFSIRRKRSEVVNVGRDISDFFSNTTAENYAQNKQMEYFIFKTSYDSESMQPLWTSLKDFQDAAGTDTYSEAVKSFLSVMSGVDKDFEKRNYEVRWLIRMGYMNENYQLINSEGQLIDEEGRLIDETGRFINENGDFVDIDGNLVDEDGNLLDDAWGVDSDQE